MSLIYDFNCDKYIDTDCDDYCHGCEREVNQIIDEATD